MNEMRNPALTGTAKALRKAMTKEERRLWYDILKLLPITVNRQKVIGRYITDFYIASAKTVIEIDGAQHYEEEAAKKDRERDEYLASRGIRVLRYSNRDITGNFEGVCADILHRLRTDY